MHEPESSPSANDPSEEPSLRMGLVLAWFVAQLRSHWLIALAVLGLMTVQLGFTLATPTAMRFLFDEAIPNRDFELLVTITIGLALAFAIGLVGKVLLDRQIGRIVSRVVFELSNRLFYKVMRLPSATRRSLSKGDLQSRFTADLAQVEQALQTDLPGVAQSALLMVGCLTAALLVEWRMTLVAIAAAPFALLGAQLVSPRITLASSRHKQHQARLAEVVEEGLGAEQVVRSFGLETFMDLWFRREGKQVQDWGGRVSFYSLLMGGLVYYGVMFLLASVMLAGAAFTMMGIQSVGVLMTCLLLLIEVGNAVAVMSLHLAAIARISGAVKRLQDLDGMSHLEDAETPVTLPPLRREIGFHNIVFAYRSGEKPVLEDLNLSLPAGQYCALVGGSGSGKSTILRILLGLEQPQSGEVRWDGVPISAQSAMAIRDRIGFVPQEPLLFDLSIRENIRIARPSATDEEIEAAARAAEVHDVIMGLPEGYDSRAGGRGGNLSGGQRQRIAIARALVRNPEILVLDEATSALDPRTEAGINATIHELARTRMVVNVTHRIASIVDADRIIVLEKGRHRESGSHQTLLNEGGAYSELYAMQSGFVATEDAQLRVSGARLRRIPLFEPLDDAHLEELSQLFYSEEYIAGQPILTEGTPGSRFLLIARGRVQVSKGGVVLANLEEGNCIGEISLLRGGMTTATCTAVWPTTCLALSRQHFSDHILRHDAIRQSLEQMMEARLEGSRKATEGDGS